MKLLIITCHFYPQKSSTGPTVSITNLAHYIKDKFDLYVITLNHEVGGTLPLDGVSDGWNTLDCGKVYYLPYGKSTSRNIYKIINSVAPDVIYQNSFFAHSGLISALVYARKSRRVKLIIAPRGEFLIDALRQKRYKKNIYIFALKNMGVHRFSKFHSTSPEETACIRDQFMINDSRVYEIPNLPSSSPERSLFLDKNQGELKMVYIARIHRTKNLLIIIEALKAQKGKIIFDIYGGIRQKKYWQSCLSEIKTLPSNVIVNYCGVLEHDAVFEMLKKYHVLILPTQFESFGHSIAESLLCSRPVIISDQTPWTDVTDNNAGVALALDDITGFEKAIRHYVQMDQETYWEQCCCAKRYIDNRIKIDEIVADYIQMFKEENSL